MKSSPRHSMGRAASGARAALRSVARPMLLALSALLGACGSSPLQPWTADTVPLVRLPITQAGIADERGRFREIFCAVLAREPAAADARGCDDALTRVGTEPSPSGRAVGSGPIGVELTAMIVPGIGYECVEPWLQLGSEVAAALRERGIEFRVARVDALSSSRRNAAMLRDALLALPADGARVVLIGYSKGIGDILEAVVAYPEVRGRIAAVASVAGAVGGSPLANDAEQYMADLMQHFPGAQCGPGDGGGVESLRTGPRQAWLAANPLPKDLRYYSVVTLPKPERISAILKPSWHKLSAVDARNDSQVIFSDQVLPGSTLLGYLNADHWAVAIPISSKHPTITSLFVTQNAYPRLAMLEALMRFVAEDRAAR